MCLCVARMGLVSHHVRTRGKGVYGIWIQVGSLCLICSDILLITTIKRAAVFLTTILRLYIFISNITVEQRADKEHRCLCF